MGKKTLAFSIFFALLTVLPLSAQTKCFSGHSSLTTDPVTRHHIAFMDAFIQYIQEEHSSKNLGMLSITGSKSELKVVLSCNFLVLSSSLDGDVETVTLSFGEGIPAECILEITEEDTDNYKKSSNMLCVEIRGKDSSGESSASLHNYKLSTCFLPNAGELTNFSYKCNSTSR